MYWKEPFEFRPSRFIDTPEEKWNRDACRVSPLLPSALF